MDVKWIKITTDMFDNRKIRHLRRLPDGNSIVLIWVMLLTLAGRCNSGGMIFLTENIPYTTKMLADELDFEENTVTLALNALEQFGMVSSDPLKVTNWEEYQNVESMDRIREQNRLRKQKQRQLESASRDSSRDSHVTSQQCHATEEDIDIDIDKEKEEVKKEEKELTPNAKKDENPASAFSDFLPAAKKVLEAWNKTGLMKVKRFSLDSDRGRKLISLVRDVGIETVLEGIERAGKSEFMKSGTWRVTLDWFLNPDNFQKTLEGQYDEKWERKDDDLGGTDGAGGAKAGGGSERGDGESYADYMARRNREAKRRYPGLKDALARKAEENL